MVRATIASTWSDCERSVGIARPRRPRCLTLRTVSSIVPGSFSGETPVARAAQDRR